MHICIIYVSLQTLESSLSRKQELMARLKAQGKQLSVMLSVDSEGDQPLTELEQEMEKFDETWQRSVDASLCFNLI